jgi:hypothetical protein
MTAVSLPARAYLGGNSAATHWLMICVHLVVVLSRTQCAISRTASTSNPARSAIAIAALDCRLATVLGLLLDGRPACLLRWHLDRSLCCASAGSTAEQSQRRKGRIELDLAAWIGIGTATTVPTTGSSRRSASFRLNASGHVGLSLIRTWSLRQGMHSFTR